MKWNTNDIINFLKIYEQYPILWNIKEKNYSNTKVKDDIFKNLLIKLNEKQVAVSMDVKQLKAKIKSIKDVYRQEINKIEKSKKSGCGTEEVYTPKLAWFKEANFLVEIVATRSSTSNFELSQSSEDTPPPGEDDQSVEFENDHDDYSEERSKKSPEKMGPPPTTKKKFKKRPAIEETPTEISQAIKKLDEIAKESSDEKPYGQFGKFVASELRLLPLRHAILLQQKIQNCIIISKLLSLEQQEPQGVNSASQFSASTSTSSMNEDEEDMLHQVLIRTFGEDPL